jgi:hypothetical protein
MLPINQSHRMLSITELIRRSRHSRACPYTQNISVCGLLGADKKGQCCNLATIQATALPHAYDFFEMY